MSLDRLYKEFHDLHRNPICNCGITIGLVNENSYKDWKITMTGPKDSCYKGGIFLLNAHFPDNYPNEPPEVFFITPIYNLNVNPKAPKNEGDESLGHICISTLNWWKPEYTMREVLYNIYLLFYCCNSTSGYGIERTKEYIENNEVYWEKAKYFTKKYAKSYNCKNYDRFEDWDFDFYK